MVRRLLLAVACLALEAAAAPAERTAVLGDDGVLRWGDNGHEVALFGVNYYVPFAQDYELVQRRKLDPRQAIRDDLEHLQRLGLGVIRLHCWDREISDREGNLVDNDHLELLDYLLAEARKRGMYALLTPIAWWGTPNPSVGFSNAYDMPQMTTEVEPRRAQCRFLAQFVTHRNRYTGKTYAEDPAIIAFEVINEPLYPPKTTDAQVTEYINALVDAVRSTGCAKPVAYNCWVGRGKAAAAARCDALTFGWYPTGLVGGSTITDNCLPRVDRHGSMHDPVHDGKLKMVYEFDAADVHGSYLYPAIARTFRLGGIQIAAQFQYDPMCIAAENRNWQTHYLNLVYTPSKAISFAIAAEAFRTLPRGKDFGRYPDNTRFGNCRVSFEEDLSEFVTETEFLYSNTTRTQPPAPGKLRRIMGCGSSPVVEANGGGAYFLDRISDDAWLLQAYPTAVVVDDPYRGQGTEKVRPLFGPIPFRLRLPGWSEAFSVCAPNGQAVTEAKEGAFTVAPGEYLLVRTGAGIPPRPPGIPAFVAPAPVARKPMARIDAPGAWREGTDLPVRVTVAARETRDCSLRLRTGSGAKTETLHLTAVNAHEFTGTIPGDLLTPGRARFEVQVTSRYQGEWLTQHFPGGLEDALDLGGDRPELLAIGLPDTESSLELRTGDDVGKPVRASLTKDDAGRQVVCLETGGYGPAPSCASVQIRDLKLPDAIGTIDEVWLELRGAPATRSVEIAFCLQDGRAFGGNVLVSPDWGNAIMPLAQMHGLWGTSGKAELTGLQSLRITSGAWLVGSDEAEHRVELRGVTLIPGGEGHVVDVRPKDAPVSLVEPGIAMPRMRGADARTAVVGGARPGRRAMRVTVPGFGDAPSCTSGRMSVSTATQRFLAGKTPTVLVVTARSVAPATDRVELALIEEDGAPWGTVFHLAPEWQEIRIPLDELAYFSQWSHPAERGTEGDRLRPANVRSVSLCFGAWLYPEAKNERHGFDIQSIAFE